MNRNTFGRQLLTGIFIGSGVAGMIYFALLFSVQSPAADIANLDLMNQRTNGILISAALFIAGFILDLGHIRSLPGATQKKAEVEQARPVPVDPVRLRAVLQEIKNQSPKQL